MLSMNISTEDAGRLNEIAEEMATLLGEFKDICRHSMSSNEYQQFKYRTLGHLEPGISDDHEWMTEYSSIDSLVKVAENARDDIEDVDGDDIAEENGECGRCGEPLGESGECENENCPECES